MGFLRAAHLYFCCPVISVARVRFAQMRRPRPARTEIWRNKCLRDLRFGFCAGQPIVLTAKRRITDSRSSCDWGGANAIHEMQHSQVRRGCDLRHFELCVPGVRWTNGRTRQGVPVSGRMPDGLASGVGASIRRTPLALEEGGQTDLGACLQMSGAVPSSSAHRRMCRCAVTTHRSHAGHGFPSPSRPGDLHMIDCPSTPHATGLSLAVRG